MKFRFETTAQKVMAVAIVLAGISLGTSWYIARQEERIATELHGLIDTQIATLTVLAEATDRDGADAVVDAIVKDCSAPERERFDFLLSNLETLRGASLQEVDTLFARCGDFYAQRKAMMVSRLERELSVYQSYVTLLQNIDGRAQTITYPVEDWQSLVALGQTRSSHTSQLVVIQGQIIDALIAGEPVTGKTITDQLAAAKAAKDNLSLAGVQADTLRQQVLSI